MHFEQTQSSLELRNVEHKSNVDTWSIPTRDGVAKYGIVLTKPSH